MKTITIVEVNKVIDFPPVHNVIKTLLVNGCRVNLISRSIDGLPGTIINNENFTGYEIPWIKEKGIITKIKHRVKLNHYVRSQTVKCMENSDFLWTTSINSIRELRHDVSKYKHIFQLMELTRYGYLTSLHIKYSLADIAKNAWKVVTPEINRAYIERVWWNLDTLPTVLPNKPFDIGTGNLTEELQPALEKVKNEKRKIILYLGGIFSDRNLETIAKAVKNSNDYVLYIVGKVFSKSGQEKIDYLLSNYPIEYLGGFNPPVHLNFVKYAYMGVLPYKPVKSQSSSELNALYCAPNKIFEYAGFGIPMIGSDVLGLKLPFEKWNIGCCYEDTSVDSIITAINNVDKEHDVMSRNCLAFYDSVDLHKIVMKIMEE